MIDVTAYWSGDEPDNRKRRFRLRVSREADSVIALISETAEDLQTVESSKDISTILEKELHLAATSAAATFGLDLLQTVWLREIKHTDRLAIYRVVMDEERGRLINARYGELTTFDASTLRQKGFAGVKTQRTTREKAQYKSLSSRLQPIAWATAVFTVATISGLWMSKINQETLSLKSQLSSIEAERDRVNQKLMAMELIEKERRLASAATLKKVFQRNPEPATVVTESLAPRQPEADKGVRSWLTQLGEKFTLLKREEISPSTSPDETISPRQE